MVRILGLYVKKRLSEIKLQSNFFPLEVEKGGNDF